MLAPRTPHHSGDRAPAPFPYLSHVSHVYAVTMTAHSNDPAVLAFMDAHPYRFAPGVLAMWLIQALAGNAQRRDRWQTRIEVWVFGRQVTRL